MRWRYGKAILPCPKFKGCGMGCWAWIGVLVGEIEVRKAWSSCFRAEIKSKIKIIYNTVFVVL